MRGKMIEIISTSLVKTMQNPYGNYFIQEVIEKSTESERKPIVNEILANPFGLSAQKYSSNIVLKFVKYGSIKEKKQLYNLLLVPDKLAQSIKNSTIKKIALQCLDQMNLNELNYYVNTMKEHPTLSLLTDLINSKLGS